MWRPKLMSIPSAADALPGRDEPCYSWPQRHLVNGNPIAGECPDGLSELVIGMGCFWGAERLFWQVEGVYSTSVGYGGGHTPHPTYEEVCTGMTGHNELVRIWYDPKQVHLLDLLALFWQEHDPTQGMRQGNDIGTQYRSGIYLRKPDELAIAEQSREHYQRRLQSQGNLTISTEIVTTPLYYLAEEYHQQYLAKHPNGYCGLAGCGVSYR